MADVDLHLLPHDFDFIGIFFKKLLPHVTLQKFVSG